MKRLYAVTVLILFIFASIVFSVTFINKRCDLISDTLTECKAAFNTDFCEEKCLKLNQVFASSKDLMSIFTDRSVIDQASLCIVKISEYEKYNNESAFFAECAALELYINEIKENENISLLSFF